MANRRYSAARSLLSVLSLGRNVCEISVNVNPTPLTTGSYITARYDNKRFSVCGIQKVYGGLLCAVGCGKKHGTAYGSRLRYYAVRKLIFFCADEKTGLPAADEGSVGALVCRAKTDIHSTPKSPSPTCRQRSVSVRQTLSCSAFL